MKEHRLLLDSRSRNARSSTSRASYTLNQAIHNVVSVKVRHISFANTLFNVVTGHNDFHIAGVTSTLAPGFYSSVDFMAWLTGLANVTAVLNTSNNVITWTTVGAIDLTLTTMRETLGLQQGVLYMGGFTTTLFLASPLNVSFCSPQLGTAHTTVFSGRSRLITSSFVTVPVTSGFGEMCFYSPSTLYPFSAGGTILSNIDIDIRDSLDGRDLTEISHYSVELEVTTTH